VAFSRSPGAGHVKRNRPRFYRPRLEALESRTLLSVCTVDRLTDNNPSGGGEGNNGMGDLRWCVIESLFRDDTINFSVTGTINLAGALPTLTGNVSIDGPGANLLTVRRDTGGSYRIFTVASGVTVAISGLTIRNGNPSDSGGGGILNSGILTVSYSTITGNSGGSVGGGGISNNNGTLTISNSTISGNTTNPGGIGSGGGISNNNGTLTVSNSTITGNSAGFGGGGGIDNENGTLTISNSTISGNTTNPGGSGSGSGGGVSNTGTLMLNNSTVSGNSAGYGGGIYNGGMGMLNNSTVSGNTASPDYSGGGIYISGRGTLAPRDTIIAGNRSPTGPDVYGNLGSQGHNLIGDPQDMTGWLDTDLLHVNPMLGPLQDNGGSTQTMALLPGSPAIDAGDNVGAPMWDQRGAPFHRIVNGIIDIGAFEVQARGYGGPTHQPLPDPVPVQGMPDGPLVGQPPDLPADPTPVPEPGLLDGQVGQSEPVPVPTAGGQHAPATSFGTYPGTGQPGASLVPLSASDLDALALNMLGGP
jgi:hypothetical protein